MATKPVTQKTWSIYSNSRGYFKFIKQSNSVQFSSRIKLYTSLDMVVELEIEQGSVIVGEIQSGGEKLV